jgi:hypothetical protein
MKAAIDILNQLDADQLRQRLDELEAEEKAVKVLLRAAARIEKRKAATVSRAGGEGVAR